MADVEIRIDDPQETWDALYRRIAELGEHGADAADTARGSAGPRADGLSEAESFLLAMWGFV